MTGAFTRTEEMMPMNEMKVSLDWMIRVMSMMGVVILTATLKTTSHEHCDLVNMLARTFFRGNEHALLFLLLACLFRSSLSAFPFILCPFSSCVCCGYQRIDALESIWTPKVGLFFCINPAFGQRKVTFPAHVISILSVAVIFLPEMQSAGFWCQCEPWWWWWACNRCMRQRIQW